MMAFFMVYLEWYECLWLSSTPNTALICLRKKNTDVAGTLSAKYIC